ncbi:MAG TPA: ABC transporter substrate-binding protein [Thermoanaerobaculia bacterium]|nr:ABC transporter substrate-binding protein [Thermoanaerobaculia bacterium]
MTAPPRRHPTHLLLAALATALAVAPAPGELAAQEENAPAVAESAAVADQAAVAGLTAAERRGKQIYVRGESASGSEVVALMGEAAIEVPASALPCAGCHGRDGRGRPEGGVDPSDLTWEALTRPYDVETTTGRTRGPYDTPKLKRAITLGIDASGNEIDAVMPRYRLTQEDATDLIAYIQKLGRDLDPGVTAERLTLGLLLPPAQGSFAAAGEAVRGVVDDWVEQINANGGFYSRQLAVRQLAQPADPAARAAAVDAFLDTESIFALVAPFLAGADAELADLAEERGIPMLGPLTLQPDESFPLNRQLFYLDGGAAAQGAALVENARGQVERPVPDDGGSAPKAALLHPSEGSFAGLAADLAERLTAAGFTVDDRTMPADGFTATAEEMKAAGVGDVFLIAPGNEEAAFLSAATGAGWSPRVHLLGSFAGPELLAGGDVLPGRLFVAFTSLPTDRSPAGLQRYHQKLGHAEDAPAPNATEIATYAALDLLAEGLRTIGRDVSREGLIEALEDVRDHPTGLLPPVSYGPNRRVGARGAWVLEVGPEGPVRAEWVEPPPG